MKNRFYPDAFFPGFQILTSLLKNMYLLILSFGCIEFWLQRSGSLSSTQASLEL